MNESTFKETEHTLYHYKDIDKEIEIINFKLENLNDDISVNAISYNEKSSPTNKFNSSVENEVIKREEIISKLIAEKKSLEFNRKLISKSLELLSEEEREIVKLRYFSNPRNSWNLIALKINASVDHCMKTRKKIINRLAKYITE